MSYKNPGMFVLLFGAPFNFDMGWEDLDKLYHDETDETIANMVKTGTDPCQWSDERKAAINALRDMWVRLYDEWCEVD